MSYDYMACMDYMDPDVCCPKKAVKSIIHLQSHQLYQIASFGQQNIYKFIGNVENIMILSWTPNVLMS